MLPIPVLRVTFLDGAQKQIEHFADSYENMTLARLARPEAVRRLREAVREAADLLLQGRGRRCDYPAVYVDLATPGDEWLKVHRYWFGYQRIGETAVIFAVMDEASDMHGRLAR